MSQRRSCFFGMILVLLAATTAVAAEPIVVDYTFDMPQVVPVRIDGQEYQRVVMPDAPNGGQVGEPRLPACGATVLLPYGTEAVDVKVSAAETVSLGTGYLIEPVGLPFALSKGPQAINIPKPDPRVYSSAAPFPGAVGKAVNTQNFRGYRMVVVRLQPVQYVPATGELLVHQRLTVTVETAASGRASNLLRGLTDDEVAVRAKVANPDEAASYRAAGIRGDRSFSLLIITTPALATWFQPLKAYHDAHSMPTEIRTTADIGSTDAVQVREYIRERYLNDGIDFVIIGGDDDVIPAKDLYVGGTSDMPGDIFFSCLDGSWNHDGDGRFGEPTDGEDGGDVDLVGEVYVGRACVDSATEVTRFCNKIIWYASGQHGQPDQALLVGEYLGFGGVADWGGNYLDELKDGSDAHGYTTVGIPTEEFTISTLYERDGSWGKSDLVNLINNGLHFLNHLGHGAPTSAMKLNTSDIVNDLTNNDLCLVYSQTCLAGHFDGAECWAETASIKTDHGAFAVIMNAREGYGEWESTDGPSQRYDREFWDAVFSEGWGQVGVANQDSKEDNIYRVDDGVMRWCMYEINLFGDPTVAINQLSGMRVGPGSDLVCEGQQGGPFTPNSKVYTIKNYNETEMAYEVTCDAEWVTITDGVGTIPALSEVNVTVGITGATCWFGEGQHDATVSFVNTTDHDGDTSRDVIVVVGVPTCQYAFNFDLCPLWFKQGQWQFGQPTGQGGLHGEPDPTSGHTGNNVYGVNLNGDYSTSAGGPYYVASSPMNCVGMTQVELHFWRWLNSDSSPHVTNTVEVSTNGIDWNVVWTATGVFTDSSWTQEAIDISSLADGKTIRVRWGYQVGTYGVWAYSGWNIDDVEIWGLVPAPPPLCAGDADCSGVVDYDDIDLFVQALNFVGGEGWPYECPWLNADCNMDGNVAYDDIDPFVARIGSTCE